MSADLRTPPVRPRYGVDAPAFPAVHGAAGAACLLVAARRPSVRTPAAAAGAFLLATTGIFLHTTLRGKLRVWERILDEEAHLKGDEHVLDLGCGRGAVLVAAARRLPEGRAVGVDVWAGKDQSGNRPQATLANAAAAGVADRIELHTADVTALPFPDASFSVVTSALVLHNIPAHEDRYRALDEALRVLRPGGRLLVADVWFANRRHAAHLGRAATVRSLGPAYWYGNPLLGVSLLHVVKDH